MLSNLSYQIKNRVLLAGAVVLALLSWNLAFRKTYQAMSLNAELNSKVEQKTDLSVNPDYLKRKHDVLGRVLKQYTLDSAKWRNNFWLKVSRAAAVTEVAINYNPSALKPLSDSATSVARQDIAFQANFKKLVSLLDSLEKMEGAGFINSSRFQKEKKLNVEGSEKLFLKASFTIVQKEGK